MSQKKRNKSVDVTETFFPNIPEFNLKKITLTAKQKEFVQLFKNDKCNVIFLSGPAGSSKSFISVFAGLMGLREKKYAKLKYLRAAVESCQNKLGFLPGDKDEKIGPFCEALFDKLEELIALKDQDMLIDEKRIEVLSPNFLRGCTFSNSLVVIDEAQNLSFQDNYTILTRIGENSTLIFCYDKRQADIRNEGITKLADYFYDKESEEQGIYHFEFGVEDIKRSEILKYIIKHMEERENDSK